MPEADAVVAAVEHVLVVAWGEKPDIKARLDLITSGKNSFNLNELGISRKQLIVLGILVGTDFNPGGIKGIGPKKGLKLIKQYGENFENLFNGKVEILCLDSEFAKRRRIMYKLKEKDIKKLSSHLNKWQAEDIKLNIFLMNEGVRWLESRVWNKIYTPHYLFYANALDAKKEGADFVPEVIFSGDKSLQELIQNVDAVYKLEEI